MGNSYRYPRGEARRCLNCNVMVPEADILSHKCSSSEAGMMYHHPEREDLIKSITWKEVWPGLVVVGIAIVIIVIIWIAT